MDTRITLRAARVNAGLRLIDAAERVNINKDSLSKFERDSSDIPRSTMVALCDLYKYPGDNIFFGIESDYFRIRENSM